MQKKKEEMSELVQLDEYEKHCCDLIDLEILLTN